MTEEKSQDLAALIAVPADHGTDRARGRPKSPVVNYGELERLLVEGELIETPDGPVRIYATHAQLAVRFGVTRPLITQFATKKNIKARRSEFEARQEQKKAIAEGRAARGESVLPEDEGTKRRGARKALPWDEIEALLVMGEPVALDDGTITIDYPSQSEIARRFGCSVSTISEYAKHSGVSKRRAEHQTRVAMRTEEKVIEIQAEARSLSRADLIKLLDDYFLKFSKQLKDGRVRTDNPADFNTLARLKEFLEGNAESRTEVQGLLTLEAVQARYQQRFMGSRVVDPLDAGMIDAQPVRLDKLGNAIRSAEEHVEEHEQEAQAHAAQTRAQAPRAPQPAPARVTPALPAPRVEPESEPDLEPEDAGPDTQRIPDNA